MFLADTFKNYIGLFSFSQVSHSLEKSIESLNVNKNQQYCFQIYREEWMIDRYIYYYLLYCLFDYLFIYIFYFCIIYLLIDFLPYFYFI